MAGSEKYAQAQSEIAARLEAAAQRAALGAPRGTYTGAQPEASSISFSKGTTVVCAVLAVALFAMGMPTGVMFALIFLVIAVGCWIAEVSTASKNARIRLHLYEGGLAAAVKNRVHAVRYDSTDVLQGSLRHTGVGGYTDYTYKLTDVDGAQVTLQGRKGGAATGKFSGHGEWGAAVQTGVTRAQLPDAVDVLNSGGRVEFGKLWLTRDEVGAGSDTAQWREVEELRVIQGFLRIKVAGKWRSLASVAVAVVPNFFVFLTLAEQLRGSGRTR
ncbi:DUF6585 family protein [Streptomyces sp. NPDC002533]